MRTQSRAALGSGQSATGDLVARVPEPLGRRDEPGQTPEVTTKDGAFAFLTRGSRRGGVVFLLGVLGSFAFLSMTYLPYDYRHLTGDDLWMYISAHQPGGFASDFWNSFTRADLGKFRPAVTPLLFLATHSLGIDFRSWVLATSAVFSLVGGVLGYLAWRLSGGSYVVASLVVMCALFSRFAGFFVLQGFGMMESVALLWMLVTLLVTLIAWERRSSAILAMSSIPFALSAFAHERYVVLVGFVLTVALLAPWAMSRRRRASLAALPLLVVLLDYVVKEWFLAMSFLQGGGGGSGGGNSTSLADSLAFFVGGAINTLGFNAGDPIWAGRSSLDHLGPALAVMALFILPVIVLAVRTVVERGEIPDFSRKAVIAASLYGPLLVSASIQSRQEWRWLVGPFVVILLGIAWSAPWLPRRSAVALVPIVALLGSLAVDVYYRPGQEDNYYHAAQRTADNIYDTVVADHAAEIRVHPVILVTNHQLAYQDWYLQGDGFFDVYAPGHAGIYFADDKSAVPSLARQHPGALIFDLSGDRAVQRQDLAEVGAAR